MTTNEFALSVLNDFGFAMDLPTEYKVDFHGAENKNHEKSIILKDKGMISVAVAVDKVLEVEKKSGIGLCRLFGKAHRLGYTGGFETTKEYLMAQTQKDGKTVNSMINVGTSLFDVDCNPLLHRLMEFDWSKALELVTMKVNKDNLLYYGVEELNSYIDSGYIVPTTPLSKLKEYKATLATGHFPKDWVTIGEDKDGNIVYNVYCGYDKKGNPKLLTFNSAPFLNEEETPKKPTKKGGTTDNGTTDNGIMDNGTTDNGIMDNGIMESGKTQLTPIDVLDDFTSTIETMAIIFNGEDIKAYNKIVLELKELFKKYDKKKESEK